MSNSLEIFKRIQKNLNALTDKIQQLNKLNLTDEANFAEDIFGRVLDIIFNLKLISSNTSTANSEAVDLFDEAKRTCVQVTSNQQFKAKKQLTLKNFNEKKFEKFTHIKIVFITSVRVNDSILKQQKVESKTYEGYDLYKLLNLIRYLKFLEKQQILSVLDEELGKIEETPVINKKELKRIKDLQPRNFATGILINRSETVKALFEKVQHEHCLVIGQPGMGKTFLLNEFNRYCWENKCVCIAIKVNELFVGTDEELNKCLNVKNWVRHLNAIKLPKKKFIVFDAFDTAKDERLKNNILLQIKHAIDKLVGWVIIVSVRTYDASKSAKLLELFTLSGRLNNCSNYEVKALTANELETSLNKHSKLWAVYESCKTTLKQVVCIPYFLKIFEEVVEKGEMNELLRLQAIGTQEQLLSIFWERKIKNSSKQYEYEKLLLFLTKKLFDRRNLNVDFSELIYEVDTTILTELIGENFLSETGVYSRSISFSHNILFDYAVARFILKPDKKQFILQIIKDPQAPFIFRPSYLFLLSECWNNNNILFWELYYAIYRSDESSFRIIHQMLFNPLVASLFKSEEELKPLLDQTVQGILINRFLQGLRFVVDNRFASREINLIAKLSEVLQYEYLWIVGFITNATFIQQVDDNTCGIAAINYLRFILRMRRVDILKKELYDNCGSFWGIQNIIFAFQDFPKESSELILEILDLLKEQDFNIGYFYNICENIERISDLDQILSAKLFREIYLHIESSQKETSLGGGVVVNLRSNRRQDFNGCHFILEEFYPKFLQKYPETAIDLGLEIINTEKQRGEFKGGTPFEVKYNEIKTCFVQDYSVGEPSYLYTEGIGRIIAAIFDYLSTVINNKTSLNHLVSTLIKGAKTALIWKNCLKFFTANIAPTKDYAYELLQNEVFYIANETTYETGELIKIMTPLISKSATLRLEKKILSLLDSRLMHKDFSRERVARILGCFPTGALTMQKSRKILQDLKGIKNEPLVQYSGLQRTEREYDPVKENNVDVSHATNSRLYDIYKQVNAELNSLRQRAEVEKNIMETFIETIMEIVSLLDDQEVNDEIRSLADNTVAELLKFISQDCSKLNETNKTFCVKICEQYLNDQRYYPTLRGENTIGLAVMYTPNVRITISEALVGFSNLFEMPEIGRIISASLLDNDPIVKANAAGSVFYFYHTNQERFWKLIEENVNPFEEYFSFRLIQHVCHQELIKKNPIVVDRILKSAYPIVNEKTNLDVYPSQYIDLVFAVVFIHNSSVAKNLLSKACAEPKLARVVINQAFRENYLLNPISSSGFTAFLLDSLVELINLQTEAWKLELSSSIKKNDRPELLDYLILRISKAYSDDPKNKQEFYWMCKPIIKHFISKCYEIEGGLMVAHTGYYLSQYLQKFISIDALDILKMTYDIVLLSAKTGFANDKNTLKITIDIVEQFLADYKELLLKPDNFEYLLKILGVFAESGWQEALELIWRLNEIF